MILRGAAAVQLRPLDVDAVRDYLCDDAAGPIAKARWDPVIQVLGTKTPAGQALRTPLMVGLARAVYNPRPGELAGTLRDPAELCDPALAHLAEVESLLYDAFIPAAYRDDAAGRWTAQQAETWLGFLARHLEETAGSADLAWWQLQKALPRTTFRVVAGLALGLGLLNSSSGFVIVLAWGLPRGLKILRGRGKVPARDARIRLRDLGAMFDSAEAPARGVRISLTGLPFGLMAGLVAGLLFGRALAGGSGSRSGIGFAFGLAIGLVGGLVAGLMIGFSGASEDLAEATDPWTVLARDRRTTLLVIFVVALAIGFGAGLLAMLTDTFAFGLVSGFAVLLWTTLSTALTIGLVTGYGLSMTQTAWPSYILTRGWLALHGRLPWSLMSFLSDAHRRGVLRQAGAVYQFRHIELQRRLARTSASPGFYYGFQDVSGTEYWVTVEKIIDPAQSADQNTTPHSGTRFVGVVFTIRAGDSSPQGEYANRNAAAIGNDGQIYSAAINGIAACASFINGSIHVAERETVSGSVAFQVPNGVELLKVQWTASGHGSAVRWEVRS